MDLVYRKDFLWSVFFVETEHASKKTLSVNSFCVDFVTTFRYRKDFFYRFFRHHNVFRFPFGNLFFVFNWVSRQGEGRSPGPGEPMGLGARAPLVK